jgi:hypothetical protein
VLDDARPPHPPLPVELKPLGWDEAYPTALAALREAAHQARSLDELARVSRSVLELNWAVREDRAE